jgi:hypothetical protein
MWKTFVIKNESLVMEICTLDEMGYPLATTQAELTIPQKMFLFEGHSKYQRLMREAAEDSPGSTPTYDEETTFKDRYRERMEENRRKHKARSS